MPAVTIRDAPDDTRNELAARAARSGRSLQEFRRLCLIEMADRPDKNEVVATRPDNNAAVSYSPNDSVLLPLRAATRV